MSSFKVFVVQQNDRTNLTLKYVDPITGNPVTKSARTKDPAAAQKAAGVWQTELEAGIAARSASISWDDFRDRFDDDYLAEQSVNYQKNVGVTLDLVERVMSPDRLGRLTEAWLNQFRNRVRAGRSPATVGKYLQHLRTLLEWAKDQKYIREVPAFPKQKKRATKSSKAKGKGRAITTEEFERILAKSPTESLSRLLRGLWLSGLRLGEALALTWDEWEDGILVEIDGDDVYLLIDGDDQKNGEAVVYPVVDEFADFLKATPDCQRLGFVFNPSNATGRVSRRVDTVSGWIIEIGAAAGVKVDQKPGTDADGNPVLITKFASAHDLRRAFGFRWSLIVPPMVLRDLMRHASVQTTEQFYVGQDAKRTLEAVRKFTAIAEQKTESAK